MSQALSSSFCLGYFGLASERYRDQPPSHEESRENPAVDLGRGYLRGLFRRGQAELQKERQEMPDERQQGM